MTNLTVHVATVDEVTPAYLAAWHDTYDDWDLGLDDDELTERLRASCEGDRVLAARVDGEVVGMAVERGRELAKLYVHPDHQGQGVGSALLAEVSPHVRSLWVSAANSKAREFYEANGWFFNGYNSSDRIGGRLLRRIEMNRFVARGHRVPE